MTEQSGVVVYGFLRELGEGAAVETGFQLVAFAGQVGHMGGGYFFENESADIINRACVTPVYDENDKLAGTIPNPETFLYKVLLGRDDRFDPKNHQYRMEPPISTEQEEALWQMRKAIQEQLRTRREDAKQEYALVSEALGTERMDAEEARALVERILFPQEQE
jgi:hypothetical protein